MHSLDFYSYEWKSWIFKHPLVVCAGPSCCPFAKSGKRKREQDARSLQGLDTVMMAAALGALVIVLENVEDFVLGDSDHGLFSDIKEFLESKGYVLVKTWRLTDYWTGGGSQRIRVFPVFEAKKMASTLPAFVDCSSNVHQTFRSSWLDPVELASAMEIPGDFALAHNERQLGKPHVVGFFNVVSPSNGAREWALGQTLTLRGSQDVKRLLERKEVRGIIWVRLLREEKNRAFSEFK